MTTQELKTKKFVFKIRQPSSKKLTSKSSSPLSVLVTGAFPPIAENDISVLFCNEKKTGGGEITDIKHDTTDGTAVITYKDSTSNEIVEMILPSVIFPTVLY